MNRLFLLIILSHIPLVSVAQEHTNLKPGFGYALLSIEIDGSVPKKIVLRRDQLAGGKIDIKGIESGINQRLIQLKPGSYYWDRVPQPYRSRFDLKDKNYKFEVVAGKINYSGHLSLKIFSNSNRMNSNYTNRATNSLEYLHTCCSDTLKKYDLVMPGYTTDPFLDMYKNILIKEEY